MSALLFMNGHEGITEWAPRGGPATHRMGMSWTWIEKDIVAAIPKPDTPADPGVKARHPL